jgi:Protein of unknown function (DUF4197)
MIKSSRNLLLLLVLTVLYSITACKKLEKFIPVEKADAGLKELLTISNDSAKNAAYYQHAFLSRQAIKIQISPADLDAIKLSIPDADTKIIAIENSLNLMATQLSISFNSFIKSQIDSTSFDNSYDLVNTKHNAASDYLKAKSAAAMQLYLQPLVTNVLYATDADSNYATIAHQYNTTVDSMSAIQLSLSEFATSQMIENYFILMSEEEIKIRTDKSHRQSALLKEVFGNY